MKTFCKIKGFVFLALLPIFLVGGFFVYAIWNANSPSTIGVPLPPDTQILKQTDTHSGFFRTKGTAVLIAQIPSTKIDFFADQLLTVGVSPYFPDDVAHEKLAPAGNIDSLFEPGKQRGICWEFRTETTIFVDEDGSDYFAAAFDLNTGLLYCVEVDS